MLAHLPRPCGRVLDVGCGEGDLVADLGRIAGHVVGLDRDAPSLLAAGRTVTGVLAPARPSPAANPHPDDADAGRADPGCADPGHVDLIRADFPAHPFRPGSFDAVVSIAALHHIGTETGLAEMAGLLRAGGTLTVVGLARSRRPADFLADLAGVVAHRWHRRQKTYRTVSAPTVWPPPESYREVRLIAARVLPGMRFRRHAMWRYSIEWTKPAG